MEFYEWAFKSEEQKRSQAEAVEQHQKAVQDEMDSIRRSLMVIEGSTDQQQETTHTATNKEDFAL